jgi:hypothetical protein
MMRKVRATVFEKVPSSSEQRAETRTRPRRLLLGTLQLQPNRERSTVIWRLERFPFFRAAPDLARDNLQDMEDGASRRRLSLPVFPARTALLADVTVTLLA